MKITGNSSINAAKIYNDNKIKNQKGKEALNKSFDTIDISNKGYEVSKYNEIVKSMPDIDSDKINDIKSRIELGLYKTSSSDIAKSMLNTIDEEK